MRSQEIAEEKSIMSRLDLGPQRQLMGSQCAGAWFLTKLGLLTTRPVFTTLMSRLALGGTGIRVLDRPFFASGNVVCAGGRLSSL